jgi:hypothetical protein
MLSRSEADFKLPDNFKLSDSLMSDLSENRFTDAISLEDYKLDELNELSCYQNSTGMYQLFTPQTINSLKVEDGAFDCPFTREKIPLDRVFKIQCGSLANFINHYKMAASEAAEPEEIAAPQNVDDDTPEEEMLDQTQPDEHQQDLPYDPVIDRPAVNFRPQPAYQPVQQPEVIDDQDPFNFLSSGFVMNLYLQSTHLELIMIGNAFVIHEVQQVMHISLSENEHSMSLSLHAFSSELYLAGYARNGLFGGQSRPNYACSAEMSRRDFDSRNHDRDEFLPRVTFVH